MTRIPLGTLHLDYSSSLFDNCDNSKTYNISYWYKKYVCIDAYCVTHTELPVGQAGKSGACVMDIIWGELKSNNIEIGKETL